MNILYVVPFSGAGGGANACLFNIVDELSKESWFTPYFLIADEGSIVESIKQRGYEYRVSKLIGWAVNDDFSDIHMKISNVRYFLQRKYYLRNAIRAINDLNIDIIHTNSSATELGALIAEELKVPHIWHVREYPEQFNWKFSCTNDYLKRVYEKSVCTIAVSQALCDYYKQKYDIRNAIAVYDGVEYVETSGVKKDEFTIIYSGGGNPTKGIWEALYTYDVLASKNYFFHMIVIAEDNSEAREYVKSKGYDRIELIGNYAYPLIREVRSTCHIALSCSETEAFGRITAEAMCDGTLVIASDRGANPGIITNGKTGLLYQYGNYEQLSELIVDVFNNYNDYADVIESARREYNERFTSKVNAEQIKQLYLDCDV